MKSHSTLKFMNQEVEEQFTFRVKLDKFDKRENKSKIKKMKKEKY